MKRVVIATLLLLSPLSASAMTTPVFSTKSTAINTATNYYDFGTGASATASTGVGAVSPPIPTAGTVSGLYVTLGTAPGAGTSYTFSLTQNGSVTALTCTISDTNTTCTDTTHSVTVAPGDLLAWQSVPTASPATGTLVIGNVFDSTSSAESFVAGHTVTFTTPNFYSIMGGTALATDAKAAVIMPTAGTFSNFYLDDASGSQTAGNGWTVTLEKNGADTAITCTINGTGSCSDTSHSVSYSAGDTLSLSAVAVGTPANHHATWGIKFAPTTDGESLLFSSFPTWASAKYSPMHGRVGQSVGEPPMYAPIAFTIRNAYGYVDVAPGGATSRSGTFRDTASDTALTLSIAGANTTASDTSHSVSVALYDAVDWRESTSGAPTAQTGACISAVAYIAPPATGSIDSYTILFQ